MATEYFTKWVEAIPMTYITGKQISKFILNYLICRYSIPQTIILDNGTPFKKQDVRELCKKFHIQHRFSTPYYPQRNGQAEATNKTILKILKKTVNKVGCDWNLQLNPALWAYRTSIRTPTGATPFSLVYGSEAILPIEVELPSLRISLQNLIIDEEYRISRLNELELLDECRLEALNHLQVYQNHIKRSYNKKIKVQTFQVGDLVLKENQKNMPNPDSKGKFEPN
jgi:transposase InsO family protein